MTPKGAGRAPTAPSPRPGFVYDAFGRMTQSTGQLVESEPSVVTNYRYNGLGMRIMWQSDLDADGGGHTSTIGVPASACLSANAICSSVNLLFFIDQPPEQRPD